jgi:hypothetical protein
MKNIEEIYRALLDGKTLKHKNGFKTTLKTSANHSFEVVRDWQVYEPKWEMEPANYYITNYGEVDGSTIDMVTDTQEFGMKYHTKEQAEKARDQMKRANLLRYWVSTMQDLNEGVYTVFRNGYTDKWEPGNANRRDEIGRIYMTRETAKKICDALNNGELEL